MFWVQGCTESVTTHSQQAEITQETNEPQQQNGDNDRDLSGQIDLQKEQIKDINDELHNIRQICRKRISTKSIKDEVDKRAKEMTADIREQLEVLKKNNAQAFELKSNELTTQFTNNINKQLDITKTKLDKTMSQTKANEKLIDKQFNNFVILTSTVLGFITLIFLVGAVFKIVSSKRLISDSKQEFREWLDTGANIELLSRFEQTMINLEEECNGRIEVRINFLTLRQMSFESVSDKEEVFLLLTTELIEKPKLLYKPTFARLVNMDIDPEITSKAQKGLEKIEKNRKK